MFLSTVHRYSAFPYTLRILYLADMMIGAALFNVRQTGLERQQAVQEKLATLACYREGINAHLTAAIASAQPSPGGLLMPNQSLLYTGRVQACTRLPAMMHLARELCGGQICVTPDKASFDAPETKPWLDKYYTVNEGWVAEDRRKLLAFARADPPPGSITDLQRHLDAFTAHYNTGRPHRACGRRTPAHAYTARPKAAPTSSRLGIHWRVRTDRIDRDGKLTQTSRQLTHTRMAIMGGDHTQNESWFVVVRRDKPQ
jgi:hypothetical protein